MGGRNGMVERTNERERKVSLEREKKQKKGGRVTVRRENEKEPA